MLGPGFETGSSWSEVGHTNHYSMAPWWASLSVFKPKTGRNLWRSKPEGTARVEIEILHCTTLTGFSSVLDRSSKDQHFLNG